MRISVFIISVICAITFLTACKKEAGEGGKATIKGRVYVKDYNASFTQLTDEYYAPKEDVYIVYGDGETFYDDQAETDPEGWFEFRFLRKGSYQVFVYSKDSTNIGSSQREAIYRNVEIEDRKEVVDVGTIEILD